MNSSHIPPYLRETYLHVDTCYKYVDIKYKYLDIDIKKILVNLYRKESSILFEITQKKFLKQDIDSLDKLNIRISNTKFKIKTFMKVLINKIFLIFKTKNSINNTIIIRSWVEDCLELFKEDINQNCTFLVYPFAIKLKRQLLFIKELKKRNLHYSLMGLNYSWIDLLKWLYSSSDLDYVNMEYNANKKHAQLLLKQFSATKLFTTDEFEIASFVMHATLMSNLYITNSAHGTGKYSPYVAYDAFYVFNNAQKEYYKYLSSNIEYKTIKTPVVHDFKFNGNIILISQSLDYNDDSFVSNEEIKLIDTLKNFKNFHFYIKLHPNSKITEYKCSKTNSNLLLDDNKKMKNSIFFTLFSTAYYDFQAYGITYLVETQYNKPELVFGKHERIIHINEIDKLLETLK